MRQMDTRTRIQLMSLILAFSLLSVWGVFFIIISAHISGNAGKQMTQAADRIIERLGGEFSQAERLLASLVKNPAIKALATAKEPEIFYNLAEESGDILDTVLYSPDFIESIVIYGVDEHYYRLEGELDNTSCDRLSELISVLSMPGYLAVTLEERNYIGYADALFLEDGVRAGTVVLLIEEEKILEILHSYDQSGAFPVLIKANDEVVAVNTDQLDLFNRTSSEQPIFSSRLGITPYEILVAADVKEMNTSVRYFSVIALITAAIVGVVLFMYSDIMNKQFYRPMVKVIGSIENLDTEISTETLPHVRSGEFDRLIDKINEMLVKLETKNELARTAQIQAKNAEIQKQKALLFSLKKQISAHFTINTLSTIEALIVQGDLENAEIVVSGLSALFHYAFDKNELINIWDEHGILENYVMIMNYRFNGKLEADIDFDDHLMEYSMPRMLLQPILENSIEHGFEKMQSGCILSVKAWLQGNKMFFTVSDNGCGMSAEQRKFLSNRRCADPEYMRGVQNIGLLNVRNRLYHSFGDEARLEFLSNSGTGLTVRIEMPIMNQTGGKL